MFPGNGEMKHYAAEDHIEQRESECEAKFLWAIEDFRCWLLYGYTFEEYVEVEDWSINELKKQRGRIKKIVNHWKR